MRTNKEATPMFYKSVVVECATSTEDLAKAIEKKLKKC